MQFYEYHEAIFASRLSYKAKLVALAIAYYYNWKESSASFPSIDLLEKRTSLSRATIHRAKQELVSNGYLTQTRRYDSSNLYIPLIPGMSQTETSLVSDGRTNNVFNNEVNNDNKESSFHSASLDNIELSKVDNYTNEVWKVFENEDGRYSDRGAAADHNRTRTAGWAGKKGSKNNRSTAKITGDIRPPGRNNYDNAELQHFNQELDRARSEEW